MSDYDPEYDEQDNSPAGLRKALEKALKSAKDAAARAEKAEQERDTALKTVKSKSIADLLRGAGVPERFAARAEKDGAEATPEGIKAWIDENKDDYNFGAKPAEVEQTSEVEVDEQVQDDPIDPDLAAAVTASQRLDASGVSPSAAGLMQRLESVNADPSKTSYEDLVAQLAAMGAPLA